MTTVDLWHLPPDHLWEPAGEGVCRYEPDSDEECGTATDDDPLLCPTHRHELDEGRIPWEDYRLLQIHYATS